MESRDRKVEEIRRKVISKKKRKFKILLFLFFIGFLIYGFYFAKKKTMNYLWNLEVFKIKEIRIYPENITPLIRALLNLEKGKNLLFLDAEELREKINSISEVEYCKIVKIFPSTLQIDVILRVPWAILKDGNKEYVIDRNGVIINGDTSKIEIQIYGIKVNEEKNKVEEMGKIQILNELDKWYNHFNVKNFFRIKTIDISDLNKIEISDGERKIFFTKENIREKMEILFFVLKNLKNDFEYIDTRFKNFNIKFK
ncbi:MAG: cell division protein FtsQ/DivIB [Candidatus Ratteibacteria bacterium]